MKGQKTMGLGDKFKRLFNSDSDYYDEQDDVEEEILDTVGSYSKGYTQRNNRRGGESRDYDTDYSSGSYGSSKVVDIHTTAKLQVVLKKPEEFSEASSIADELLDKRTVVLNLESTEQNQAGRLLCFLSGVAYANGGKLKKIANNTYIITPYNVDVMGDLLDELENNGMFFI